MTGFLIAVLSGTLMSVQGVFNTQVTKTAGHLRLHRSQAVLLSMLHLSSVSLHGW